MQFYFAPMEGITTWSYRQLHRQQFSGVTRYYTPFLTPTEDGLAGKTLREVLPQNNRGVPLVPQTLTNDAEGFLRLCRRAGELGYDEVDLNLGCPSGTVVAKGRGAGFLAHPQALEAFLDRIFDQAPLRISLKTRIGMTDPEEFGPLLELYARYPLAELIVHPRLRSDFYKNKPNWAAFGQALAAVKAPVCYNGDIFSPADLAAFSAAFPQVDRVMLGRGLVADPALARELGGGPPLAVQELRQFHASLYAQCKSIQSGERNVLCRMKEQWSYWGCLFEGAEKPLKKLRKAQHLADYDLAVEQLLSGCPLRQQPYYRPQ